MRVDIVARARGVASVSRDARRGAARDARARVTLRNASNAVRAGLERQSRARGGAMPDEDAATVERARADDASVASTRSGDDAGAMAPRWRCVASSADLRAVSSKRVRFTCVDATRALVILGANTGSAYVFARSRARDDGAGGAERRARFVAVVSPELVEPSARGKGNVGARAAPQSVRTIKASPCGRMCALGFADGHVRVIELDGLTREEAPRRSALGSTVAFLSSTHEGRAITALSWSSDSRVLYAGSDQGMVTVTSCAAFVEWCDGGRTGARPAAMNKTSYTDVSSAVHQLTASASGCYVITSAQSSAKLVIVQGEHSGKATNIGSKQREGSYGSCFHRYASLSVEDDDPVEEENEWDEEIEGVRIVEHAVVARPGRKLWIAKVDSERADVEIMATIKPEVPVPSSVPGWDQSSESADAMKRASRKLEFGLLHRLGPCVLSTTERAVAVIDVATPAIVRWYPLKEPGSESMSAGFIDACTVDHRAFFLTPSEGSGNSVWCLESFVDAKALAHDVVSETFSTSAFIRALDICRKTNSYDDVLFRRAKEALDSSEADAAGVNSRLAFLMRWGEQVGSKLTPAKEDTEDDLRELVNEEEVSSPKAPETPDFDLGKPPLGRDRSTIDRPLPESAAPASNEFPKAETEGGIFFYNPRGVSKTSKVDGELAPKANSKVKKRQALILDDVESNEPEVLLASNMKVVSPTKSKNYGVDLPNNDIEWEECDAYDAQEWQKAMDSVTCLLPIRGVHFEHWSCYEDVKTTSTLDSTDNPLPEQNARIQYRFMTNLRVAAIVDSVTKLKECRMSLDASILLPSLRRWRNVRAESIELLTRFEKGEDAPLTAKMKLQWSALLEKVEKELDAVCDELKLDVPAVKKQTPPKNREIQTSLASEEHSTDSMTMASVTAALTEGGAIDMSQSLESECVASLRSTDVAEASAVVSECLRRALLQILESLDGDDTSAALECGESHLMLVSRVGSAAVGAAEVIRALARASEEEKLSRAISPTNTNESISRALSRVFTRVTTFLTSENSVDLDLRRGAAKLLEPLDAHLSRPPMRQFGRFPQLQAALAAEIDGVVEQLPFVCRSSTDADDAASQLTLKVPHENPIAPAIEDFGDWGVKMDLRHCPACSHSLLCPNDGELITFMCAHTYHKACCAASMACFACCADSR